jgi:hypothetical protein
MIWPLLKVQVVCGYVGMSRSIAVCCCECHSSLACLTVSLQTNIKGEELVIAIKHALPAVYMKDFFFKVYLGRKFWPMISIRCTKLIDCFHPGMKTCHSSLACLTVSLQTNIKGEELVIAIWRLSTITSIKPNKCKQIIKEDIFRLINSNKV